MAALSASLMASASARAPDGEVKEKTCVSGAVAPGAWAKIFSITFGLLAGVCWRSRNVCQHPETKASSPSKAVSLVTVEIAMFRTGEDPGAVGFHETDCESFDSARLPSFFLYDANPIGAAILEYENTVCYASG